MPEEPRRCPYIDSCMIREHYCWDGFPKCEEFQGYMANDGCELFEDCDFNSVIGSNIAPVRIIRKTSSLETLFS